ncbi:MAG TPA: hypothetical protein VM165_01745, partial [Planctomycetaceae bacterium]|nr:hypothetical protein [Planctomycetaceae bacterium]
VMTLNPGAFGVFDHTWLAALYAVLILIAYLGTEPTFNRALCARPLRWLGTRSYGIYLLHQPVAGLIHGAFRQALPELKTASDAGLTVLSLAITLALAAASFQWFESPFLRYGHSLKYGDK